MTFADSHFIQHAADTAIDGDQMDALTFEFTFQGSGNHTAFPGAPVNRYDPAIGTFGCFVQGHFIQYLVRHCIIGLSFVAHTCRYRGK